jgi:hypothetical protein
MGSKAKRVTSREFSTPRGPTVHTGTRCWPTVTRARRTQHAAGPNGRSPLPSHALVLGPGPIQSLSPFPRGVNSRAPLSAPPPPPPPPRASACARAPPAFLTVSPLPRGLFFFPFSGFLPSSSSSPPAATSPRKRNLARGRGQTAGSPSPLPPINTRAPSPSSPEPSRVESTLTLSLHVLPSPHPAAYPPIDSDLLLHALRSPSLPFPSLPSPSLLSR